MLVNKINIHPQHQASFINIHQQNHDGWCWWIGQQIYFPIILGGWIVAIFKGSPLKGIWILMWWGRKTKPRESWRMRCDFDGFWWMLMDFDGFWCDRCDGKPREFSTFALTDHLKSLVHPVAFRGENSRAHGVRQTERQNLVAGKPSNYSTSIYWK